MDAHKHIDKLLEMADYFASIGERDLATELRKTANKMLDHILYINQGTGGKPCNCVTRPCAPSKTR